MQDYLLLVDTTGLINELLFPPTCRQFLKGYRLTADNGCDKASSLKAFTPLNSLKSDATYKNRLTRKNQPVMSALRAFVG
ncbi:MAG: hypothetical protein ACI8XX_000197 [Polaribacter sp.]